MRLEDVDKFERVQSHMEQLHKEMSALAKGKQDSPINKFKLKVINEKLEEANRILVGAFRPLADFDMFGEDDLPTNSDVVLVLSQYLDSLEGWRSANIFEYSYNKWYWDTGGKAQVKTSPPTRFRQVPRKNSGRTRGETQ